MLKERERRYTKENKYPNRVVIHEDSNITSIQNPSNVENNSSKDDSAILNKLFNNINTSVKDKTSTTGLIYYYYNFIKGIVPDDIATYSNVGIMHAFSRCLFIQARKQLDYGDAVFKGLETIGTPYLISQLYNKVIRLANLTKTNAIPHNESILDSFIDLAVYALLGIAYNDYKIANSISASSVNNALIKNGSIFLDEYDILKDIPKYVFDGLEETSTIGIMLDYIKMIISNNPDINMVKASLIAIKLKEITDILS